MMSMVPNKQLLLRYHITLSIATMIYMTTKQIDEDDAIQLITLEKAGFIWIKLLSNDVMRWKIQNLFLKVKIVPYQQG